MSSTEIAAGTEIRPFTVEIEQAELDDLRSRIAATRWPETETVADQSQGVQLATIQELARYWGTDYDFRRFEARLNALPQFITEIDGLDIHFIYVRSPHENALPLIITHGWPGSVVEMLNVIGPHRPAYTWRRRRGRVRRGGSVDARLRVLVTNTGVSSGRLYWENTLGFFDVKGVSVPAAVSVFPRELYQAPRSWTEQAYPNLIYFNEVDEGNHFAAWQEPALFTTELRAAFRTLR
jgi:hypothetical protein